MIGEGDVPERLSIEDDPTCGSLSDQQKGELIAMTEKESRMIRRARSAMILSWVAAGLCLLLGGVAEAALPDSLAVPTAAVVAMGLLTIAAVLSVSYYVRVRGLSLRVIDARLANIEGELARLSAESRPPEDRNGE